MWAPGDFKFRPFGMFSIYGLRLRVSCVAAEGLGISDPESRVECGERSGSLGCGF